jgi:hypothetical protein
VTVEPFGRRLHLWPDSAERLGVAATTTLQGAGGKLVLDAPEARPVALAAVVVLVPGDGANVSVEELRGAAAVRSLRANAYRVGILKRWWEEPLFRWAAAVASSVPVFVVRRPPRWSIGEVGEAIAALAAERCHA